MGHNRIFGAAIGGLAAAMLMPAMANGQTTIDRVSASEKGSLLMFSKFDVRWDDLASDVVTQDTIITMSNDSPDAVGVQFYVVDGATWTNFDIGITLTGNQPMWWSLGNGEGTIPMPSIDQFARQSGPGYAYISGFVYAWAVDGSTNFEISHNHLSGSATIVNYYKAYAFEYNAYSAARAEAAGDGDGTLNLDSTEYDSAYSQLLLNFIAVTSNSQVAGDANTTVAVDTDLALHVVSVELDSEPDVDMGDPYTKAHMDIWNEFEVKLSGQYRCIFCFDETLLSEYNVKGGTEYGPNHFLRAALQTEVGKARIDGIASPLCDVQSNYNPGGLWVSQPLALLGIAAKIAHYTPTIAGEGYAAAASNLIGMGYEDATVHYKNSAPPPTAAGGPVQAVDNFIDGLKRAARGSTRN